MDGLQQIHVKKNLRILLAMPAGWGWCQRGSLGSHHPALQLVGRSYRFSCGWGTPRATLEGWAGLGVAILDSGPR